MCVLNKPKGLVVHGSPETGCNFADALVNGLVARYGVAGLATCRDDGLRPGIVHRLDGDTSGVMVVARTNQAYDCLHAQFRDQKKVMERKYVALVMGGFGRRDHGGSSLPGGTIDMPIGRHPKHGTKRCVFSSGQAAGKRNVKHAVTHWSVEQEWQQRSVALVSCQLETGRTHQIRVHMKEIHHPLLCDPLYGPGPNTACAKAQREVGGILLKHRVAGQLLHAQTLAFEHPTRGGVSFAAPLPQYFQESIALMSDDHDDKDETDLFDE